MLLSATAKAVVTAMMIKVSAYSGATLDRQETICLAQNIYHEARGASVDNQVAVAYVTLNRARATGYTICATVHAPNQFSWVGKVRNRAVEQDSWESAVEIAALTQVGFINNPIGNATHYHSTAVSPAWADRDLRVAVIDNHIFYEGLDGRYQRVIENSRGNRHAEKRAMSPS